MKGTATATRLRPSRNQACEHIFIHAATPSSQSSHCRDPRAIATSITTSIAIAALLLSGVSDVMMATPTPPAHLRHCDQSAVVGEEVRSVWRELDNISKQFTKVPVSGGIFLYPRQTTVLTLLLQRLVSRINAGRASLGKAPRRVRVCETGFGNGQ